MDQLAVVTGAGSGIGLSLASRLHQAGWRLALCERNEETLAALGPRLGDQHLYQVLDIADREAVEAFAGSVLEQRGTPDLVIHNAGISLSQNVINMDYADFERVMDVNFWGMVYGCKAFLPAMLATGTGTQVFVSSIFGIVGIPTQSAYNASKFAIRGFAESLREEVGKRMHVLVVCPGGVRTNIIRNGKVVDWPAVAPRGDDAAAAFERIARLLPDQAAEAILDAVKSRRKRLVLGRDAQLLDTLQRLFPTRYNQAASRLARLFSR